MAEPRLTPPTSSLLSEETQGLKIRFERAPRARHALTGFSNPFSITRSNTDTTLRYFCLVTTFKKLAAMLP
jgi:hypothetical protein